MGDTHAQGTPTIEIVSPQPGETVTTDDIDVQVEVSDFTVDCAKAGRPNSEDLEGKQNVPGYGHWHVFVDKPMGAMMMDDMAMEGTPGADEHMGTPEAEGDMDDMHMMAMGGMILMPGTNSFEVDLTEWGPGEHTIFIEPVQNDHTNFAEFGHAEFTVTVEEAA